MSLRLKPVRDQVMVVTGGSSGIGLATAMMAAQAGARVVLAARSGDALAQIRREIEAAGGRAEVVVADVGRKEDVDRVVEAAVRRFGGFDTWVNNAGTGIFGKLLDLTDEDQRRVFDTNFWGLVYGSVAAVNHLKRKGGALLNVGSVASDTVMPVQGMYVASKHAVLGFTDALRMEVEADDLPVCVTLIRPAAINTPFPHRARNYFDREPKLPPPLYEPDEVAAAVLHAAEHPQRDVYVGTAGRVMSGAYRHFPETFDWIGARVLAKGQFRDEPARHPAGALHQPHPAETGRARGDHPGVVMPVSLMNRMHRHPVLTGLLLAGVGVAVASLLASSRK